MRVIFLVMFLFSFFLSGCETVRSGAQEIGRPVGAVNKAVGGITEGAAEGYGEENVDNPYNR
ncbi:MAG: hypothetical protein KAS99_06030 [Candidatus Omnitrophica bacterium]|nr:hypothetical protein [Candidatus Omnitrophota bacterium]